MKDMGGTESTLTTVSGSSKGIDHQCTMMRRTYELSSLQTREDIRELGERSEDIMNGYDHLNQEHQSLLKLNKRLAKVNAISAELMAELEDKNRHLNRLNERLAQANASSAQLMAELEEKNGLLLGTNRELARANAHAAELMAVVEIKNEEIEKLNRSISRANAYAAELLVDRDLHAEELRMANRNLNREIQQRKEAEEKQVRLNEKLAETNEEMKHVIYVTSHDLRSPMVNIKGFSWMLRESVEAILKGLEGGEMPDGCMKKMSPIIDEDIPDALRFIDSSIEKMESLIEGLLRISRIETVDIRPVPLDMNGMVGTILGIFEYRMKEQGVSVTLGDLPDCVGDDIQINQVVSNLVDNALKYLDPRRPGKITISGEHLNGRCIYSVKDNGVGIPEEHLEKIFMMFHRVERTRTGGEGLGLTAVKRILDRNEGRIWVESEASRGSEFFFSLPSVSS